MKKVLNRKKVAGSRKTNEPRLVGSIVSEMLQVWNNNTHLAVDLKTQLRSDRIAKVGKSYTGMLCRETECDEFRYDEHFTFTETIPPTTGKRNPHLFDGRFITVTRRDDGSLRLNFKELKVDADFCVEKYAAGVANELLWALEGLIENGSVEEESK
jgi:hypothetical protein